MQIEVNKQLGAFVGFIVLGILFSVKFPDIDQALIIPGIIRHRSLFTHSCLLGVLFYWLWSKGHSPSIFKPLALGALIGLSVHLSFDLFPKGWRGFSLIFIPVLGDLRWIPLDANSIPFLFSFSWILGNIYASILFMRKLVGENRFEAGVVLVFLALTFIIMSRFEQTFIAPLLFMGIGVIVIFKPDLHQKLLPWIKNGQKASNENAQSGQRD